MLLYGEQAELIEPAKLDKSAISIYTFTMKLYTVELEKASTAYAVDLT